MGVELPRVRRLLLTSLITVGCLGAPALAAPHAAREVIARYSFDGSGNAVMALSGTVKMAPGAVFVLTTADVTNHSQPIVFFPQVIDLDPRDGVRTYGAGGNQSICAAPLSCSVKNDLFNFGVSDSVSGSGGTFHLRLFLAARGAAITLHDKALLGWHAHHRSTGLVTRSDTDGTGGGVDVENVDVGVTAASSAPGPAGGSVAVAVPGCDVVGGGVLTLAGGTQTQDAICPSDPIGALAWKHTSWQLSGVAAGVSQNQTRLVVFPLS